MKLLCLNKREIDAVFSMTDAIESARQALASYSSGKCAIPLRSSVNVGGRGSLLCMPGYDQAADYTAVKIISVFPGNPAKGLPSVPATVLLVDSETGMVRAMLDGSHITRIRTGAAGGAGIDLLARKDAEVFALFGAGGQSAAQLEACLCVRDIKLVKIYDLNRERAESFAREMSGRFGVKIAAALSPAEAVDGADIVTAVTTAKAPVFDGSLLKRGCHVNSIGSYTPDMQEVGEEIVCRADRLFVDTKDGALSESGCLIKPIAAGRLSESRIHGELGEIVLGIKKGRQSGAELTYFDCVGTAALDVAAAGAVYKRAVAAGLGTEIEFDD